MTGAFGLPLAESHARHDDTRSSSYIRGPRWTHLPTLTIGLLGVQILWSVEMSYAPPYLLSLGLTKPNMAIVFLAGPLSGFLIQPLIGVLADNSTSRWGRRRPYMLGGCVLSVASMLLLGYTREFAAIFTGPGNYMNDVVTVWLAILSIYLIDFSINAVQAVDRALLVDTLPSPMQASGNAWAASMLGVGSVVGFFVGNLDLPSFLPFPGSSELQVLSVIVSVLILAGHFTTAALVKEKVVIRSAEQQRPNIQAEIRQIFSSISTLPRVIRQICMIQFFAWLGWFPVLFYTTMYISDLYARSAKLAGGTPAEIVAEGTRLGSRALFFSSTLALLTNLLLPLFTSTSRARRTTGHMRTQSTDSFISNSLGAVIPESAKMPLTTLWAFSHLLFAACMLGTFFVTSVDGAILLVALTGIPWAVAQWAPFSLLGEAILTSAPASASTCAGDEEDSLLDPHVPRDAPEDTLNPTTSSSPTQLVEQLDRLDMNAPLLADEKSEDSAAGRSLSAQAGVILGIHNVFIVIPQFLVTILCAVVFAVFDSDPRALVDPNVEPPSALGRALDERPNSVVYIFRLGALWALVAFTICRQLGRELR
ncbi:major facilitator superfamily domain-containing protein [Mycena maculata]|uniref:Major facilitator superfamily domain-containing protein n=1 Tax=Mycena maculata TaxID=230809 RepID=A0AAD7MUG6_9AGAR|nr:major facilitator superfamily domain-containing protein [Mycena maculata]